MMYHNAKNWKHLMTGFAENGQKEKSPNFDS